MHTGPGWVRPLVIFAIVVYLGLLVAGVAFVVRASGRLGRAGKIAVGIVGLWTVVGTVAAFLDLYRGSDLAGSALSSSFIVVYGLVGAGVVLATDWTARRLRRRPPAAEPQT